MFKNNKKSLFSTFIFIILFVFTIFTYNININNSKASLSTKSKKESSIFIEKTNYSKNYISTRILRAKVFQIFNGREITPNFVKKVEDYTLVKEIFKAPNKIIYVLLKTYSILERYKERILLI
ncbi:hypothetical protein [Fusobacterium sp.]|uniref:hypothetical protein n=1 Tax=Fusobacterium sp. TaxID=68766 RepID=UPI00260BC3DF|nr:hypothetical protein [Fusobacterium sp.]